MPPDSRGHHQTTIEQKTREALRHHGFQDVPGTPKTSIWCRLQDSNPPPDDYKSTALPDELSRRKSAILLHFTTLRWPRPLPFEPSSSVVESPSPASSDKEADAVPASSSEAGKSPAACTESTPSAPPPDPAAPPACAAGSTGNAIPCPFSRA